MKPIVIVTATYQRVDQMRLLGRVADMLSRASKLIPLTWIVVEDSDHLSKQIGALLGVHRNGTMKTIHLFCGPTRQLGHAQKALAIRYIIDQGIIGNVMFFDDDNYAHLKHFERVSKVERVGVWRVNGVSIRGTEGPVLNGNEVIAFDGGFKSREYAIDTAGFAVDAHELQKVSDGFLDTNQWHNWENNILSEMFTGRHELETFDSACYVSHNEMLGGECEFCWRNSDKNPQPNVFKIDWAHRGMPKVNSIELGQFRTLALSRSYAKAKLFEAIDGRFNNNRYTEVHKDVIIDLNKVDLISVEIGMNEDPEAWK